MNNRSRMIVQYTICLGAFLSNLSAGMFNIALVDIARTFDSTIPTAQWIVTAYLLVIPYCFRSWESWGYAGPAESPQYRLFCVYGRGALSRLVTFIKRTDLFSDSARHRSGHVSSYQYGADRLRISEGAARKALGLISTACCRRPDGRTEPWRNTDSVVFVAEQFLVADGHILDCMVVRPALYSQGRTGKVVSRLDVLGRLLRYL